MIGRLEALEMIISSLKAIFEDLAVFLSEIVTNDITVSIFEWLADFGSIYMISAAVALFLAWRFLVRRRKAQSE